MKPSLTIVIPHRKGSDCRVTLDSLAFQTFKDFKIIMSEDIYDKGANWARNAGFKHVNSKYVLFSDDDINWFPQAIQDLIEALENNPSASYSYGSYHVTVDGVPVLLESGQRFNANELIEHNYISTMSVIRSKDFLGFDEQIQRFQDWDLWLAMLRAGMEGVSCGKTIFTTEERLGITATVPTERSVLAIRKKYGI